MMIIPNKLVKGDTIGVTAPSGPIIGNKVFELLRAKQIVKLNFLKIYFQILMDIVVQQRKKHKILMRCL